MDNKKQKDAFPEYEADSWFSRTKQVWLNYSKDSAPVINLIKDDNLNPKLYYLLDKSTWNHPKKN